MKGVDSNPITLNFDHLPGIGKLAAFAFTAREINGAAGFLAPQHAAGIRAMRGDNFAGAQANIGEKTLVTLHQYPGDQFRGEMHNPVYSETARIFPALVLQRKPNRLPQRRGTRRDFFCLGVFGASVMSLAKLLGSDHRILNRGEFLELPKLLC